MAMVCCFACRSHPGIFISASFVPSLFGWNRKVYSGRREADLIMSSVTFQLARHSPAGSVSNRCRRGIGSAPTRLPKRGRATHKRTPHLTSTPVLCRTSSMVSVTKLRKLRGPTPAEPIPFSSVPLQIEAVVKRFGQLTAVDGITLELHSGECLGLLGPNGAGKSTR